MNTFIYNLFFSLALIFGFNINLNAVDISVADKQQISDVLYSFEQAVNNSDYQAITNLIDPNNSNLSKLVQEKMGNIKKYQLACNVFGKDVEISNNGKRIKITGTYAASGIKWETNGFSTYFVLEKHNNQWFISDTDFYKEFSLAKWASLIVFLLLSLLGFWIWMLVDCAKSNINNRVMWTLLLVLFNLPAAILYFFFVKLRRKKFKKSEL